MVIGEPAGRLRTRSVRFSSRASSHPPCPSAVVLGDDLLVFAGSQNDDSSIIGANGPARIYFKPWAPRAGASVVARDGAVWMFGGEDGFTCDPLPDCEAPYYHDVWRTTDGVNWVEVSAAAAWSPRPGHQCEVVADRVVCFGGFGLIENPTDVWASADGVDWIRVEDDVWFFSPN